MRHARFCFRLLVAIAALALAAGPAFASADTLRKPAPDWFTPALQAQLAEAGAEGVQVGKEELNLYCPGYKDPGVSAAACIVAPYGCTANFIFTDGSSYYIGTARHCVGDKGSNVGEPVTMQVDSTTIANVGTVAKHTSGEGDPGLDFALIQIDSAVADRWGIDPEIPVVGGPNGVYGGCGPETVRNYGHGYGVAVAQGKPEGGVATNWYDDAYGWAGFAAPGDSGSPVVTTDGSGAGNLTHLIIYYPELLGSTVAGMRLTAILAFAGVSLVNADGSFSAGPTSTSCGGSLEGGGGNGGGNGGGKPDKGDKGGGKPDKTDDGGGNGKGNGGGPPHRS